MKQRLQKIPRALSVLILGLIGYELLVLTIYAVLAVSKLGCFPITLSLVHYFMWTRMEILVLLGCLYVIYLLCIWFEGYLQKTHDAPEHNND